MENTNSQTPQGQNSGEKQTNYHHPESTIQKQWYRDCWIRIGFDSPCILFSAYS